MDFEIIMFSYVDGDVPRSTSYAVYISKLMRFARASSLDADLNTRKNCYLYTSRQKHTQFAALASLDQKLKDQSGAFLSPFIAILL